MNTSSVNPERFPTRLRQIATLLLTFLIVNALAWELWLAPLRPGGSWLALKACLLMLPLGGIAAGRRYTYQWASMFILFFVLEGTVRAMSDPAPSRWLALAELAASIGFFIVAIAFVRSTRPLR